MKKKALKYTIFLLLIPLTASLLIAIITNNGNINNNSNNISENENNGKIPDFSNKTTVEEIKSTNTYMYISVFTLCVISGVVLIYIKKEKGI